MAQVVETLVENRKSARTTLSWPISLWLPEANRFFNGKTLNVAKGGVLLSMPMTTPIRPGHVVEINFPRTISLAKKKGQFARIKTGKVVRVERDSLTADATISVAIQFTNKVKGNECDIYPPAQEPISAVSSVGSVPTAGSVRPANRTKTNKKRVKVG